MLRSTIFTSLLLSLLLLSETHAEGPQKPRALPGQVEVKVSGFRSGRGQVFVALWRSDKSFPGTPPKGTPSASVKIVKGVATAGFRDVPPGVFAVSVFHDEDGDGELKTNFIGIPKEGIGFSRDARARFGPPGWDDAKLVLEPGEVEQVNITMLYY